MLGEKQSVLAEVTNVLWEEATSSRHKLPLVSACWLRLSLLILRYFGCRARTSKRKSCRPMSVHRSSRRRCEAMTRVIMVKVLLSGF